jgi:hypothetical protein
MQTIQMLLNDVKDNANVLKEIQNNFEMGLITLPEMHNQMLNSIFEARETIAVICSEYDININAVNLMLTL